MNPKISVVIPVYNVEKYLEDCVKTVCGQTYKNLEIILVDDGSSDNSLMACRTLAEKDERIRVIHKENGGPSDARNVGTLSAEGEYITFIDADDLITETYVEYLFGLIKKFDCEMSLCSHTVRYENGKEIRYGDGSEEKISAEECLERMLYHDVIDTTPCAKLYRTEMAKKTLYPKGKLFEDIGTTYQFFIQSKEIACGYKSQYIYMQRKNSSIIRGPFNPHKLDMLEMTDKMAKDVVTAYPALKSAALRRRVYARFSTLNQLLDVEGYDKERKEIIEFIKKNQKEVLSDKKTPRRDRVAFYLLRLGYPVYRMAWKMKKRV